MIASSQKMREKKRIELMFTEITYTSYALEKK